MANGLLNPYELENNLLNNVNISEAWNLQLITILWAAQLDEIYSWISALEIAFILLTGPGTVLPSGVYWNAVACNWSMITWSPSATVWKKCEMNNYINELTTNWI